jgi:hypothetical protein
MKASDILLLAGGAAAIGLASRQKGSRSRQPSLEKIRDEVNAGLLALRGALVDGPGELEPKGKSGRYEFFGINAAAYEERGEWYPAKTMFDYDYMTGESFEELSPLERYDPTRNPHDALLIAIGSELEEIAVQGALVEAAARQHRSGKGSRSKMASFEDAVTRGFQRALASAPKEARGLESDGDGYQTDRVGALLVRGGISSRSIVGQKKLDGYRPVVYDGEGEAYELEQLHHNPAHALLAAEAYIAFSTIENAVHESGLAQELQQAQRHGRQAKKMGLLR